MSTISFLRVYAEDAAWAQVFVRSFDRWFRGALMDAWEQLLPALEVFAQVGGELCLSGIEYECSGSYLEEYCRVFREAARQVPEADYAGAAFAFREDCGGTEYITFLPKDGTLKVERIQALQPMATACPRCGAQLEEPVDLYSWISRHKRSRCRRCGGRIDPKKLCGAEISRASLPC